MVLPGRPSSPKLIFYSWQPEIAVTLKRPIKGQYRTRACSMRGPGSIARCWDGLWVEIHGCEMPTRIFPGGGETVMLGI